MDTLIEHEPPPDSTDLEGWRSAVADGRFREFPMEAVVAAIQDLGPDTDKLVLNPLALHASDTFTRILRARIGKHHPNEGVDIIERAHAKLVDAMLDPQSADGKGLRVAFVPRVHFRAADAIRTEQNTTVREKCDSELYDGAVHRHSRAIDASAEMDQKLHVKHVLELISDERKRLAFYLFMEDVPLESTRTTSIADVLDVSSKTAGKWIEEVRDQLREIVGERQ